MYRRPKFLEILLEIRREMALEADYDVDLFAEIARSDNRPPTVKTRSTVWTQVDAVDEIEEIPTATSRKSVGK